MFLILTTALAGGTMSDPHAAIRGFVEAADDQDAARLESFLHPDFRVVAQMPDGVSVLDRATYVSLVANKTLGGTPRKTDLGKVHTTGSISTVRGTLDSDAAHFDSTWTLVESDGQWLVMQDATVFAPRK